MKLTDLETGMRIELRNGKRYIVQENVQTRAYGRQRLVFVRNKEYTSGADYNIEMESNVNELFDIMTIYNVPWLIDILDADLVGEVLWHRKEKPGMNEKLFSEIAEKVQPLADKLVKIAAEYDLTLANIVFGNDGYFDFTTWKNNKSYKNVRAGFSDKTGIYIHDYNKKEEE